jgi:hypothetical protein
MGKSPDYFNMCSIRVTIVDCVCDGRRDHASLIRLKFLSLIAKSCLLVTIDCDHSTDRSRSSVRKSFCDKSLLQSSGGSLTRGYSRTSDLPPLTSLRQCRPSK